MQEPKKKPRFQVGVFTKRNTSNNIQSFVEDMVDYKLWERLDKPKDKEVKITIAQKVLILHYSGALEGFKKGVTLNKVLSSILGCHEQTAKDITTLINDFDTVKTPTNLSFLVDYFKEIKMNNALELVNKDFEKLGKRLKNKSL